MGKITTMGRITIQNPINNIHWEKEFEGQEFKKFEQLTKIDNSASTIKATLVPIRTQNLKDFLQDIFFPTTLRFSMQKTKRSVALIASAFFDLFTFPIRLITAIPRVLTNPKPQDHPLYKFLKSQKVDPKLLDTTIVDVRVEKVKTKTRMVILQDKELTIEEKSVVFTEFLDFMPILATLSGKKLDSDFFLRVS